MCDTQEKLHMLAITVTGAGIRQTWDQILTPQGIPKVTLGGDLLLWASVSSSGEWAIPEDRCRRDTVRSLILPTGRDCWGLRFLL